MLNIFTNLYQDVFFVDLPKFELNYQNAKHALKNTGKETLEFYWIFPTDRFSDIEYLY